MESIWIPFIIFKNTDRDEAVTLDTTTLVSVTREGNFKRSGSDVADEVKFVILYKHHITFDNRLKYLMERRT